MSDADKARILVIDDDRFFRDLLRVHLTHAGYAVQVADDAIEGGKALLHADFDLVLCDVNMPFLTGLELVFLLRATPETASIPVVFSSSRKDADTMTEAEKSMTPNEWSSNKGFYAILLPWLGPSGAAGCGIWL